MLAGQVAQFIETERSLRLSSRPGTIIGHKYPSQATPLCVRFKPHYGQSPPTAFGSCSSTQYKDVKQTTCALLVEVRVSNVCPKMRAVELVYNQKQSESPATVPSDPDRCGGTLCCDNRRLIGTPLIVIAWQSQKNHD